MLRKALSLVSVLSLIFFCATLYGQTQGEITGVVTDATGAVLPGATVTVTNAGTNATRTMKTNATGVFDFPSLLPGVYSVTAEAQGFEKAEQSGIELQVQQVIRSNFRMTVGQATETVAVSTAAPLVDTEDVTVGTVIGTQRIEDMPLNGRNFLQLVSLSPNVVYGFASSGQAATVEGGQRASTTISIAGQRAEYNYYTLDGLNDTDDNFNTYLLLPSVDALQEFKVQYGVYPAEYGRNTGQINVSTKQGTNNYHGALWEFNRNSVKDAFNYNFSIGAPTKSPLNRNQFGFTLGGPVKIPKLYNGKDRLFFMTNYEGQRFYTADQLTATLPPTAFTGNGGTAVADFSGLLNPTTGQPIPIYDPQTESGGPGTYSAAQFGSAAQLGTGPSTTCTVGTGTCNMIPVTRFDKDAVYLLKYWIQPNVPNVATQNYVALSSLSDNSDQFTVRIDLTESQKSAWFGRYSWSNELNVTPAPTIGSGSILTNTVHQSSIGNTRSITPSITNEVLFGYSGMINGLLPNSANDSSLNIIGSLPNGVPAGLASPTPIIYGIPGIGLTNYTGFGAGNAGQIAISYDHIYQAVDNVSMVRGKHTIQYGVEFRRDQYNQEGNSYVTGSLSFSGAATALPTSSSGTATTNTGNSVADFMLGITSSTAGAQLPLAVAQLRASDWYLYVQDTFKVRPNLTISYGIRYELNQPFWSKHDELFTTQVNDLPETEAQLLAWCPSLATPTTPTNCATPAGENNPVVVRQGSGNNFYSGIPWTYATGVLTAQDGRLGKYLANFPKKNFAPRLGIAWNPTDKWSVRTGYGLFYAEDIGNFIYDTTRNRAVRRNATGAYPYPNLTIENPFAISGSGLTISNPTVLSEWPYRQTPYELQWELNVQRQLTPKAAIEVGYNGSEGHHLFRFINYNVPPPEAGSSQAHRPFPLLGPIQDIQDYVNATYNGMEVKYTQQMSHGVNGLIGYTWSRSVDNGSAIRSHGGDADFPQNTYCKNGSVACGERGPSNFDQTHRIVSSLLYEPPIGRGQAFLNHGILAEVAGGWQFNEIFSIATGFPYSLTETANQLNGGGGESSGNGNRPSYVPGVSPTAVPGGRNWHHWINSAAFQTQPAYTWGNVSRNSLYGPYQMQWDSSVMKMFPTWREQSLQIRFEAFNAANHPNFGFPSSSYGSTTFSQITSAGTARQLQLSAKYYF